MADSSANNIRKNSLPSASHPLLVITEQDLIRVIESFKGTLPYSHVLLTHQFSCLKALYESLGDALHLKIYQKDLACEKGGTKGRELEEILEGSIMLLDMCRAIKDCYTQIKDGVKELESSIRRKGVDYEIGGYITSKKILHKMVSNCFKEMKKINKHYGNMLEKDDVARHDYFLHLLKRVQRLSFEVLKSSLCFISHAKASRSKLVSGWSCVSKFLKAQKVSGEDEMKGNLFEKIEVDLEQLIMHDKKSGKFMMKIQNAVRKLKILESSMEELEQELECVFRLLLRTRVYLLNNVHVCTYCHVAFFK